MSKNYCTVAVGLIISLSLVNLFLSNVITDPDRRNVYSAPKVKWEKKCNVNTSKVWCN